MKANELMIGDWVVVHRPGDRHEQVRVKSVIGNGTIEAKTSDGLVAIGELAVEPIPLTAEVLEKNDFKQRHDGIFWWPDLYRHNTPPIAVELWMAELFDNFYIKIEQYENARYSYINTCNEVHELQHALRLCGIEKEIAL